MAPKQAATAEPAPAKPARFFDEMSVPDGGIRPAYREFWKLIETFPRDQLLLKQAEADALFRRVGITFLVYGEGGNTERLIPFDIVPRIIPAADWQRLAEFYQRVFGCELVPPERNQSGQWLADGTGVPGAALRGVHLRLPGHGPGGPTLEIYSYSQMEEKPSALPNRKGFGHLAFAVDDVEATLNQIISCGGRAVGKIVSVDVPGLGTITFTYAADPEDNLIELQKWS